MENANCAWEGGNRQQQQRLICCFNTGRFYISTLMLPAVVWLMDRRVASPVICQLSLTFVTWFYSLIWAQHLCDTACISAASRWGWLPGRQTDRRGIGMLKLCGRGRHTRKLKLADTRMHRTCETANQILYSWNWQFFAFLEAQIEPNFSWRSSGIAFSGRTLRAEVRIL